MKVIFTFFLVVLGLLLLSCHKEQVILDPISDKVETGNNQFYFYKYSEFRPAFTFAQTLVDSRLPGGSINLMLPFPNNIRNPFPIDPVVNLGRILFYDKNLSINGTVSCGTCHQQDKAFTDGRAFSIGFNHGRTDKGSMSLQNMDYLNNYQWESGTNSMTDLVVKPLLHPIEMGNENMQQVIDRIKYVGYYDDLHARAFGNSDIQEKSIIHALSQFISSIYSNNSKYDKAIKSDFANLTSEEKLGLELFNGKALCNTCHAAPTFAAPDFSGGKYGSNEDISLAGKNANSIVDKKGKANNGLKSLVHSTMKSIKIPTLRNIEKTAPYMHDGSFTSLDEVIDAYNENIKFTKDLDEIFIDKYSSQPAAIKLNLSAYEKKALKSFLLTLTDTEFLTAKRYSDPF